MLSFPLDIGWNQAGAIYCAPSGTDSASGVSPFEPKLTGYAGAVALQALGGGTLYLETGTSWGGPAVGGQWFERAGLNTPGFVQMSHGMTIEGRGRLGDTQVFQRDSCAGIRTVAAGAGRRSPGIWVKSLNTRLTFKNIIPLTTTDTSPDCPWRIGWDYLRKGTDVSTVDITVTNASRAAGSTTLTVTLPTYNITNASRTGTTVTIRATIGTALQSHDWVAGGVIKVTSTDGNFPSGDFTMLSVTPPGTAASLGYADITYTQAGAATTGTNIGTMGTHGVTLGEWIDLFSTSAKFPSSMYRCTSVPASNQLVVEDIYGYAPRSASDSDTNIGVLVHEDRSNGVANCTLINCAAENAGWPGGLDDFKSGPALDVGSSNATSLLLQSCLVIGNVAPGGSSNAHWHADRCGGILLDAGHGLGASIELERCSGSDAGVRLRVGVTRASTDQAIVTRTLFDTSTGFAPPLIDVVEPNPSTGAIIDLSEIADNAATIEIGRITGDGSRADPNKFKTVRAGIFAISPAGFPGYIDTGSGGWGSGQLPSPWTKKQYGFWAAGRIAGRHPGANRAMGGVASATYQNLFLSNSANWTLGGGMAVASTTDTAEDGSATAYKITGSGTVTITSNPVSLACAIGGRLVIGAWLKGNYNNVPLSFGPTGGGVTFLDGKSAAGGAVDIIAVNGWQWFQFDATIATLGGSPLNVSATYSMSGTSYLWGATVIYVPDTVDAAEYGEFFGTLRHQAAYLAAGMSGTMENHKFVCHGGIATGKYYTVGAGAGQVTLGAAAAKAIEFFDEAGNSLGVVQPNTFTLH